jgi:hypothetical protein
VPRPMAFEDHSSWSCAFRVIAGHADLDGCTCACHDPAYAQTLLSRGYHVHRWRGRLLEGTGLKPKVAIRCMECPMQPPIGAHPDLIRH